MVSSLKNLFWDPKRRALAIWFGVTLFVLGGVVFEGYRERESQVTTAVIAATGTAVEASATSVTADTSPIASYPQTSAFSIRRTSAGDVRLCQYTAPNQNCNNGCGDNCNRPIFGVDCSQGQPCTEQHWHNSYGPIPWQAFGQGEYVGAHRSQHVDVYRLRVDDVIEFIYRLTREATNRPYQLQVGDTLKIESVVDPNLSREVTVQPDGSIVALHIGRIRAARRTVEELKKEMEDRYKNGGGYKIIDLTITPTKVNTRLEDLRAAVDSRFFTGGQGKQARVTPEGTVRLPAIGSVCAVGLTLDELKQEVDARYQTIVDGLEVTPILFTRAPRFVYVLGEVKNSGRFTMEAPTTIMQALSLSGGWNIGANLREVVVFRRAEDWRLLATRIDIRGAVLGKRPMPADEIWLRDSDIVVVPKSSIQRTDEFIDQVFTKGIYGVVPSGIISGLFSQQNATF